MLREKIRGFFVKLAMYMTVGAFAIGSILFVIRSLYPQDGIETARMEEPTANAARDKKAPPVEIKGSISDETLKKDMANSEDSLITMVPETPKETTIPEAPTETAVPETEIPETPQETPE